MKPRPVLIEWTDSCHWGPGGWVERQTEFSACDVITVGWLIKKTSRFVVVSHSISESGDVTGTFVIPAGNVKRLVRL